MSNTENEIRKLPETYTVDGEYEYRLIKRGNKAVIYGGKHKLSKSERLTTFEVFKIKVAKPTTLHMNGKTTHIPAREKVPNNEAFGKWALHAVDMEQALSYFEQYENEKDDTDISTTTEE